MLDVHALGVGRWWRSAGSGRDPVTGSGRPGRFPHPHGEPARRRRGGRWPVAVRRGRSGHWQDTTAWLDRAARARQQHTPALDPVGLVWPGGTVGHQWWHLSAPSPELLAAEAARALATPGAAVDLGCGLGREIRYRARISRAARRQTRDRVSRSGGNRVGLSRACGELTAPHATLDDRQPCRLRSPSSVWRRRPAQRTIHTPRTNTSLLLGQGGRA